LGESPLKAGLVAVLLSLSLVAPVAAGPFEDGLAAYDRGDYAIALRFWRLLGDQGNAAAQLNIGLMYYNGQGVPQDYAEAVKWFRKAADQGYAAAQDNLGFMYDNGESVLQDYVRAHMWYNLAAASFPASDAEDRDKAVKDRDLVAAKMTPAQIAEAKKLAREWKPSSP
jgi:TPR repeat protein